MACRIIIIGAGTGGLVAAIELAAAGFEVEVLESMATPGGKMRQVCADGTRIDAGPTVLTLRGILDEVFEATGDRLDDHLDLQPAGVLARHAWTTGGRLDLHADRTRTAEAIAEFSGPAAARGFLAMCEEARRAFESVRDGFLHAAAPELLRVACSAGPLGVFAIQPFTSLWGRLGHHFRDPRLQQLFGRYATYCGASPYLAPATLLLVIHAEQQGVWLVNGGMYRIAGALAALARRKGARLRFRCRVTGIDTTGGRVRAVLTGDGERLPADAVVYNGDIGFLAGGGLGPGAVTAARAPAREARSLSAITFAVHAKTSGFPLLRHNVFFSDGYAAEFEDIFGRRRLPVTPTVYVCAQDRNATGCMDYAGDERLLCLVNAPPDGDRGDLSEREIDACRNTTFATLQRCGLSVTIAPGKIVTTTPADFERLFPGSGGALYGRANHGWRASFLRPGVRSRLPGLYLAGGSVHPGPGVPMAALSGRLAAAAVRMDLASTIRSRVAATAGGTSMP